MKTKNIALSVIGAFALSAVLAGCGDGIKSSNGARHGIVQKFSLKGMIFKSGEGELVLDGIKSAASALTGDTPYRVYAIDQVR